MENVTVLELELQNNPEIANQMRIIDTSGPSPCPPLIVVGHMPVEKWLALQEFMVGMAANPQGREILHRVGMSGFATVDDRAYDPIREMEPVAFNVQVGI